MSFEFRFFFFLGVLKNELLLFLSTLSLFANTKKKKKGGLALSSTAVAMQVLQDRGESGSRHGRATFAVLLLQDLAVVVLLMLIPLLAPGGDGSSGGGAAIARALGLAAVKAVACIVTIMAGEFRLLSLLEAWEERMKRAEEEQKNRQQDERRRKKLTFSPLPLLLLLQAAAPSSAPSTAG